MLAGRELASPSPVSWPLVNATVLALCPQGIKQHSAPDPATWESLLTCTATQSHPLPYKGSSSVCLSLSHAHAHTHTKLHQAGSPTTYLGAVIFLHTALAMLTITLMLSHTQVHRHSPILSLTQAPPGKCTPTYLVHSHTQSLIFIVPQKPTPTFA